MNAYHPRLRDFHFVLHELLNVVAESGNPDLTQETLDQVLEAAARFAEDVIAPLNGVGDAQGCTMPEPGVVVTPNGFKEAYQRFTEGGWCGLACAEEDGGQGLPAVIYNAVCELFVGANMAWASYPGMSHAAYTCLAATGSDQLKAKYLPYLASGAWAGTMCLTEPHCGTDLGLLRTRAVPQPDGSFLITGTKIFISGGEQDLTENIVHLVLARLPDAPTGVKGISLFLVPKYLASDQGELLARNGVVCGSVEHKMGIHGNSTCTMNFDGAQGWMIGEANKGLAAMFVMMNHARIGVSINAIGQMEGAYQKALAYAKERAQGRAAAATAPGAQADLIIEHADVRRMLLTQKAYVEGSRALALWATQLGDIQHSHPADEVRAHAAEISALITPVVKAFCSDAAVDCTSLAMQVYGGHGYIVENHVEQHLRDARIIPLYEGANGIQAMDLLGRKIAMDGGKRLVMYLKMMGEFVHSHQDKEAMREFTEGLGRAVVMVRQVSEALLPQVAKDPHLIGGVAVPYLRLIGHVSLAWMWARMAAIGIANVGSTDPIYAAKIATARFYYQKLLPEIHGLAAIIASGAESIMEPTVELL